MAFLAVSVTFRIGRRIRPSRMPMRTSLILLVTSILIGLTHPVVGQQTWSQSGEQLRYTLDDCIAIALQRNIDVRQVYASSQAAAANLTQAFGQYLPAANFGFNYNRQLTNLREQISIVNGVPIRGEPLPNTYSANLNVGWTLFNGFRREADYDAASSAVSAAEADILFQRLAIAFNVTRAYIDVLRTEQVVRARSENLSLSRATFERVKALYDNGRAPITQLTSQETEVANQEVAVVQAENDHDLAKVNLLTLMNVDPTQNATFDPAVLPSEATSLQVEEFRTTIGSEQQSIDRAMASRPDVRAAQDREEAAQATVTSATAGYYPTLQATGGYVWRNFEFSNFDNQGQWFVGLNLQMPVFDQFRTNQQIASATFQHTQRSLEVARLEQQLRQNVRSAYLQLRTAERNLDITERALRTAQLNFDAMQERFTVGGAQLVEVQQANFQLITARINRVTAVYGYLDARTFVEFATGLFTESVK